MTETWIHASAYVEMLYGSANGVPEPYLAEEASAEVAEAVIGRISCEMPTTWEPELDFVSEPEPASLLGSAA